MNINMPRIKQSVAFALLPLSLIYLPATAASTDCDEPSVVAESTSTEKSTLPEKLATAGCKIKHVFQSRIRYRKMTEPVEMTVGSPPMVSDDTGTPGDHKWEINLTANGDFAGKTHRIEAPLLDLNYGIGDAVQLKVEVPYVFLAKQDDNAVDPQDVLHAHGVGDATVGVKYRFYDNKDSGLSWALYPQLRFRTPGANRTVSGDKTVAILPLILTREFEKASITVNAGIEHADASRLFASAGAGMRLSDQVALLGEIAGNNLNAHDERQILLNLGVRRKLSETRSVSASIGHDLHTGGNQPLHRYFSVSFQQLIGD